MRLTELFDSPYSFILQELTGDKALYYFKNSEGLDFRVQFLRESYGTWEVSFGNDTDDGVKVKRSGEGDEFRVFATVIEVIRDFMSKTKFDSIKFYAHREGEARTDRNIRDSRIDLYKRLLKRFATQNNLEFADQAVARMHLFQFRKKQDPNTQVDEEVEVSLYGDAEKGYTLSKIEVSGDERNAGQGTKVMQDIVDRMDREGAIITLTPDDAFGGNKNRLIKFYKRFGFVPNKGRNKDFRFRETMIRYPQTNETVTEAFDNPYPYRWDTKDEDHWVAKADTPTGLMLVMFEWMDGDSSWNIDFAVNGRMGKSGKGDAFRTFATVVAVIKDWVSKVDLSKTKLISFSADKTTDVGPSRSKLYKRFAIQMAIQLGWQLDINTKDVVDDFFKIINPELVDDDEDEDVWINEDGKIVPGVNTTVDVQPGETERQAAKFNLMKSSSKGPALLHKSAAKNSNPNTLSNLGLD
tara:strand:- start:3643 stop:5043 length:1401 start_codon:yes stop_codon:yes gene_type:complete